LKKWNADCDLGAVVVAIKEELNDKPPKICNKAPEKSEEQKNEENLNQKTMKIDTIRKYQDALYHPMIGWLQNPNQPLEPVFMVEKNPWEKTNYYSNNTRTEGYIMLRSNKEYVYFSNRSRKIQNKLDIDDMSEEQLEATIKSVLDHYVKLMELIQVLFEINNHTH